MKDFSDYIESCMKDYPNDQVTFIYKRRVKDEMNHRVQEVKNYGLKDENVIYDLIVDQNKDIVGGYKQYLADLKEKKIKKSLPIISAAVIGALLLIFFFIGFVFDVWHPTWLIVEGGITFLIIGLLLFAVSRINKTKYYPASRIIVAACVMIASQFIFLLLRVPFQIMDAYLIFLIAPALMFICDLILAKVTKQKLIIINYMITVPVITAFLYALLGILNVIEWKAGALFFVAALLIDIIIVLNVIRSNRKLAAKMEVNDEWK